VAFEDGLSIRGGVRERAPDTAHRDEPERVLEAPVEDVVAGSGEHPLSRASNARWLSLGRVLQVPFGRARGGEQG
jgi:hypothetical protein